MEFIDWCLRSCSGWGIEQRLSGVIEIGCLTEIEDIVELYLETCLLVDFEVTAWRVEETGLEVLSEWRVRDNVWWKLRSESECEIDQPLFALLGSRYSRWERLLVSEADVDTIQIVVDNEIGELWSDCMWVET